MVYRLYISALLLTLCASVATAQTDRTTGLSTERPRENVRFDNPEDTNRILDRFADRFAVMDSLVFKLEPQRTDSTEYAAVDFIVSQRIDEIDDAVQAQIWALKGKTGVDVRGQLYARPGANISYDPDDPLVAYNAKAQVELEWNLFHSSLYKRATKIRELRLEGELRQLEYERDALAETLFRQRQSVRYRYYGRLLTLLYVHAANLQLLMETQVFLLQNGKISSDDLMKLISEQAETERQMIAIKADSVVTPLPAERGVTYVSVADTAALMACIRDEHRDLRKLALRDELLSVQRRNIDYLQTMDILPFARFSYYNRPNTRNTHNIDVGVSFKIPLSGETSRKRRAIEAERSVVHFEQQRLNQQIERDVESLLRELNNYNENIYGEYVRMDNLKRYLQMRIDSYGNVAGEYSRIDRLQEYNAYLQAWERMLGYAYQRDCLLIELQSHVMEEPVSRFLVFHELK